LGPIAAIALIIGAVIAIVIGFKKIQIGGLLNLLLGKGGSAQPAIAVANTVPAERVDDKGNLIPIGKPDSKGDEQVQVVPIEPSGLFSDPKTVTFTAPGDAAPTTIALPDGVSRSDVQQVIRISPTVHVVTVKDTSGVSAEDIDNLLKKYS